MWVNAIQDNYNNKEKINHDHWVGDKVKSYMKLKTALHKNINIGLAIEKDRGEKWWDPSLPFRVDHLAGFLHYTNSNKNINLYVGNYQVRMGQGMVLWQGYGVYGDLALSLEKQSSPVTSYASASERNFMKGIAVNKLLGNFELTAFYNHQKLDANLDEIDGQVFIRSMRISGLHQTGNDLQSRKNIYYQSNGVSLKYIKPN